MNKEKMITEPSPGSFVRKELYLLEREDEDDHNE